MRWQPLAGVAGLIAVASLASCGGGSKQTTAPTAMAAAPATTTRAAAAPSFRVTIQAPTHRPKANAKWPVTIRVTDAAGKPIAAKLKMRILFGGSPVGQVDNGRVYRFVGSWREKPGQEITWPASAVGQPLTFQAIVTAQGMTRKADDTITVHK